VMISCVGGVVRMCIALFNFLFLLSAFTANKRVHIFGLITESRVTDTLGVGQTVVVISINSNSDKQDDTFSVTTCIH